jgi:3-hydroxyisobutyrate dehydrogenase
MGAAIAGRLLRAGAEVTVWNRTPAKAAALVAAGARLADEPRVLVDETDIVLSLLTDAGAVEAVYCGERGLLTAGVAEALFVEMSTVRPGTVIELATQVMSAGCRLVECPVGGSVGPAREGQLLALVGGETSDVERAMPVLRLLCRRIEHVGPVGAGASLKLAINLPMHVYWKALNEALVLCRPLGLDPARLIDIMADTSGAPSSLKARKDAVVAAMTGVDRGPADFDINALCKDLRAMLEEARSRGFSLPVAREVLAFFDEAAQRGFGGKSAAGVLKLDPATRGSVPRDREP